MHPNRHSDIKCAMISKSKYCFLGYKSKNSAYSASKSSATRRLMIYCCITRQSTKRIKLRPSAIIVRS